MKQERTQKLYKDQEVWINAGKLWCNGSSAKVMSEGNNHPVVKCRWNVGDGACIGALCRDLTRCFKFRETIQGY